MNYAIVEDKDLETYIRLSNHSTNPLIEQLMDGKRRFVPYKDEQEKAALGGLYTAANRRNKKCTMNQVTNQDGVKGFLIQFHTDEEMK